MGTDTSGFQMTHEMQDVLAWSEHVNASGRNSTVHPSTQRLANVRLTPPTTTGNAMSTGHISAEGSAQEKPDSASGMMQPQSYALAPKMVPRTPHECEASASQVTVGSLDTSYQI